MLFIRLLKFVFFLAFIGAAIAFSYSMYYAPKFQSQFSIIIIPNNWKEEGVNKLEVADKAINIMDPLIESDIFRKKVEENLSQNLDEKITYSKSEWKRITLIKTDNESNLVKVIVGSDNPSDAYRLTSEILFAIDEVLSDVLQTDILRVDVIDGPEDATNYNYFNLLEPTLFGAYIGGGFAIFLWVLFGKHSDSWLYSKKKRKKLDRQYSDHSIRNYNSNDYAQKETDEEHQKEQAYKESGALSQTPSFGTDRSIQENNQAPSQTQEQQPTPQTYQETCEPEQDQNSITAIREKMASQRQQLQNPQNQNLQQANSQNDFDTPRNNEDMKERLNRLINV